MSISDWSSDVCSSDLPSRKGPPCVAGDTSIAAGCVGIHPICGRPALLPLGSRQPGETSPARASSAFVAGVAATPGVDRQLDEERLVRPLRAGLARAEVAVDADRTEQPLVLQVERRRSEEHT